MTSPPTVYLFDIDGTLISTDGAGRHALESTFEAIAGPGDHLAFSFAGMTDRLIARQGLDAAGLEATAEAIDEVLDHYMSLLPGLVAADNGYRIHAGVVERLEELADRPDSAIGLGTGNIERGARIKLARGGLNDHFQFGGFGCDAEDRAELIEIGVSRGVEQLGLSAAQCRVVVIGDTPRDVAAAQAIGADCLAVATASASIDELRSCAPTHCVESLSDPSVRAMLWG
jgi:phosphoglycolate phosphatase-like HAD superfamily hydrolase